MPYICEVYTFDMDSKTVWINGDYSEDDVVISHDSDCSTCQMVTDMITQLKLTKDIPGFELSDKTRKILYPEWNS